MSTPIRFETAHAFIVEPVPLNGSNTFWPFLVKNNINCSTSWNENGAGCCFSTWAWGWFAPNPFWYQKLFVSGSHSFPVKSFKLFLESTVGFKLSPCSSLYFYISALLNSFLLFSFLCTPISPSFINLFNLCFLISKYSITSDVFSILHYLFSVFIKSNSVSIMFHLILLA